MTVQDIRSALDDFADDQEVRLLSQPYRHPLAYGIAEVTGHEEDGEEIVYIVEGEQIGYGPRL